MMCHCLKKARRWTDLENEFYLNRIVLCELFFEVVEYFYNCFGIPRFGKFQTIVFLTSFLLFHPRLPYFIQFGFEIRILLFSNVQMFSYTTTLLNVFNSSQNRLGVNNVLNLLSYAPDPLQMKICVI